MYQLGGAHSRVGRDVAKVHFPPAEGRALASLRRVGDDDCYPLLQVAIMRRAKEPSIQTVTCPDCGLVLRLIDGSPGFKLVYDRRAWQRACTRVHLEDAAWCLVQRDGTHT